MVLATGEPAPEFSLARASGGEPFTHHDLAGHTTVLVFYPFAFSTVCTDQMSVYNELLGAPFCIDGEVQHGDKRGRTLGFPTANLVPDPRLVVPDHGIYACRAQVDGAEHIAAVNVGVRPTFKTGRGLLVEAYLLDFDDDIYDHELRLDFLERLRGERRFDSIEALVEQMGRDVSETRRIAA